MLDFDNFFRNLFDAARISDDRMNRFTLEHLPLLSGYARFADLVAPTTAAYEGYFGAISDEAIKTAVQISLTRAMERTLDEFQRKVSQHEGAVRSKWGEDSPEYLRFYPQGLTEYHQANLANIDEKLTRYVKALDALAAGLDPQVRADFLHDGADGRPKGVVVRFRAARSAQLTAKAGAVASKGTAHTTRDALEIQLLKNLFTVALDAVGRSDEERAELARIFPQHVLEGTTAPATPATPATPPPPGS